MKVKKDAAAASVDVLSRRREDALPDDAREDSVDTPDTYASSYSDTDADTADASRSA